MSALDVYNFESIIPVAVKAVFVAQQLTALTALDPVEQHKQRPRTEIFFTNCAETNPPRPTIQPDSTLRNAAWRGELLLMAISDVNAEGKLVHDVYRSQVRAIAQQLGPINGRGGLVNGAATTIGTVTGQVGTLGGPLATFTATTPHGMATGDLATISGASHAFFNGTFIVTVTGPLTFTYVIPAQNAAMADNGVSALCQHITGLFYHKVQRCYEIGSSTEINTDKGWQLTRLNYALEFSIQTYAWALLSQP